MTTALITGISGQDGSWLARHLLSLGYRVTGIVRRHSLAESQTYRLRDIEDGIELVYGDVTDIWSIQQALQKFQPDEVYHLAAQSHVRVSFDLKWSTMMINGMGTYNVLESVRETGAKLYFAGSSEMFGNEIDADGYQRLSTPMSPVSPYGCAKLFAFRGVQHYRRAYGMFCLGGVLFNHSGAARGSAFVEMKIAKAAVQIKHGLQSELLLGNMDSQRDIGNSRDYVRAMQMMLQHPEPREWLVATGEAYSVRDICAYIFGRLGMDYRDYVKQDERYLRPEELDVLCGDATETRLGLGWEPEFSFSDTMDELIEHWERQIATHLW